jgi:carbon-monoxide dehydrogenase medium subunit
MSPRSFDYVAPADLGEAVKLLREDAEERIIAGGQSLIPALKLRVRSVKRLVDIALIEGLRYIRQEDRRLRSAR